MLSLHQAVLVSLGLGLTLLVERLAKAFWIRSRPYPNSIVPGPWTSSYLWGEEKELFTTTPGLLYTSWHKRYGGIVALRGCFGVSGRTFPASDQRLLYPDSHLICDRSTGDKFYTRRSNIRISKAFWCSRMVSCNSG